MTVYFIQSGHEGPIKIGHTSGEVAARVDNLQTGNPNRLHVLLEIDGGLRKELDLHNTFAAFRFRNEWFYPAHEILAFIKANTVSPELGLEGADPLVERSPMEHLLTWLKSERGRTARLANDLGISSPAISQWDSVPADKVLKVEAHTGISRHDLRPDVFGIAA